MNAALHDWIEAIYGDPVHPEILDGELSRYEQGLAIFRSWYGPGPVYVYRAPGRVNLIGEHTDYNHGYVLPIALDRDIVLLARPRADALVTLTDIESERFGERHFFISEQVEAGPLGDWENYVKGVAQMLHHRFGPPMLGMDALVIGRQPFGVPIGAGLSSSSALTVVAAVALLDLNGWTLPPAALAHLCAEAEWYVGTRGGIMDHFISVLGRREHALFLDCRPDPRAEGGFHTEWAPIPAGYSFAVCDSGKRRENTRSQFNVRVAECKIGVELLKRKGPAITHLRDVSASQWGLTESQLETLLEQTLPAEASAADLERLGVSAGFLENLIADHRLSPAQRFHVRARCRHVIHEDQRVLDSIAALKAGDAQHFGALMNRAHTSMSQDYGASCDELDALVGLLQEEKGVLGARVTGAGWGGCAVALLEDDAGNHLAERVGPRYREMTGLELRVFPCRASAGAGGVGSPCMD